MDTKKKWILFYLYIFLLAAALCACQIQPIVPATGNIGPNAHSASFIQSVKLAPARESALENPGPLPSETALGATTSDIEGAPSGNIDNPSNADNPSTLDSPKIHSQEELCQQILGYL